MILNTKSLNKKDQALQVKNEAIASCHASAIKKKLTKLLFAVVLSK